MSLTMDLSNRLAAMNIDEATCSDLRQLRPLVLEHIDAAIAAAYDQILRFPEVKRVYGNVSLDEAKRAQRQHWLDDIFAGTFTEAQLNHSIAMTEARQRSGLALRWYFVFWTIIYNRLVEAVIGTHRKRPERLAKLLSSMSRSIRSISRSSPRCMCMRPKARLPPSSISRPTVSSGKCRPWSGRWRRRRCNCMKPRSRCRRPPRRPAGRLARLSPQARRRPAMPPRSPARPSN